MKYLSVKKTRELKGEVEIDGSKNAALPIMAACLLTSDECQLNNIPEIDDVKVMLEIIESLGAKVHWDKAKKTIFIKAEKISKIEPISSLLEKMRASFLIAGPMLARFGKAKLSLPGGCAIGTRPINMHIKGFYDLGAHYIEKKSTEESYVFLRANSIKGKALYLDYPSVGTTENLIMVSVFTEGVTVLENVAKEPEIVDLAIFLNKMGAKISGTGTDTIRIVGVKALNGTVHNVIPDRIEAATYIVAGAITKSNIIVKNLIVKHIQPLIAKLEDIGVNFEKIEDGEKENLKINAKGKSFLPVNITTLPYPGFPTDLQSLMMPLLTTINGESEIVETVFENRFMQAEQLIKMGADIEIEGEVAKIFGAGNLKGCSVRATDLRSGAGLILAGLFAEGETKIFDIFHIERGYAEFEKKFKTLLAKIAIKELKSPSYDENAKTIR
ncbi:MAG: UDP-N-acetylglucosamine 1-carboxyvinyltransferase [Clostridiales Family XIII bacterium]|jgi:UDP-N-acetylglucosamine 1-carboxyvinyltransferase|nr:UDP-N-acetylglucosamine 1-carboxyvinyltransferase [Clostridiales Family XIII bacterium]